MKVYGLLFVDEYRVEVFTSEEKRQERIKSVIHELEMGGEKAFLCPDTNMIVISWEDDTTFDHAKLFEEEVK